MKPKRCSCRQQGPQTAAGPAARRAGAGGRLYPDAIEFVELSQINQAIGILIEFGWTPRAARAKLQSQAEHHGTPLGDCCHGHYDSARGEC